MRGGRADEGVVGLVLWVYYEAEDVAVLTVCPGLGGPRPCTFSEGL